MTITMDKALQLPFGYNRGLPEGIKAAWGARWIIKQSGHVDQVPDRQGCDGDESERARLLDYLNTKTRKTRKRRETVKRYGRRESRTYEETVNLTMEAAAKLLSEGKLHTNEDREVVLFEDREVIVKANPQASYGYLYVCAYFKDPMASEFVGKDGKTSRYGVPGTMRPTGEREKDVGVSNGHPIVEIVDKEGNVLISGKWSNHDGIYPQIGERIDSKANGIGKGTLVAYFFEAGFIGMEFRPDKMPKSLRDRYPTRNNTLGFGVDLVAYKAPRTRKAKEA